MARDGMANLIKEVRKLAELSTSDYTVNAVTYWTDDQIQEVLDDHLCETVKQQPIYADPDYINGAYSYTEYNLPPGVRWIEEAGTASGFALRDNDGTAATGYTVNYRARRITFSADQQAEVYWLSCRVYDLYNAVADIWEVKAAALQKNGFRWQSDNHMVDKSALASQYQGQAQKYRAMSGMKETKLIRSDLY